MTDNCILPAKDFTILEALHERCLGKADPLVPILKRKLEGAIVMFREDIPANIATLSSKVSFCVNGKDRDTRILSNRPMTQPSGDFLSITTVQGLALLGLAEGQEFVLTEGDGVEIRVVLERVHYQPKAAQHDAEYRARLSASEQCKPALRLVHSASNGKPYSLQRQTENFDDPGPSAA